MRESTHKSTYDRKKAVTDYEALHLLENRLDYHFRDIRLLETAVTHSSYANEHRKEHIACNERLEYLGDAALDFVCAEYLYRRFPEKNEGDLSKIRASMVSESPLSLCGRELGLPACLRIGKGEEQSGGRNRDSLISDAAEAVIGAVFLDGGFEAARKLVLGHFLTELREEDLFTDVRTPLQEYFQDRQKRVEFILTGSSGPPHAPVFEITACVDGEKIGVGKGHSKKAAAQDASRNALERLHVSEIH